jgi:hypothetical protein
MIFQDVSASNIFQELLMMDVTVSTRKFGCQLSGHAELTRLKQTKKASCLSDRTGRFGTSCVRASSAFVVKVLA